MGKASDILDDIFHKDPNVRHLLSPSREELAGLEEALGRVKAAHRQAPADPTLTFDYASLLISHARASYVAEGVRLMESLVYDAWRRRWDGPTHTQLQEEEKEIHVSQVTEVSEVSVPRGEVNLTASAPPEERHREEEEEEKKEKGEAAMLRSGDSNSIHSVMSRTKVGDSNTQASDDLAIHYYYLSIGWIKQRDYEKALACVNQMLEIEPNHRQGIMLRQYINAEVSQTLAATGLAGIGVAAAVAAVIGVFLRKS